MNEFDLPRSDLELLRQEILSGPPEAGLPSHLPDHWLDWIARDLEMTVGDSEHVVGAKPSYAAAPLALIIHLLRGKAQGEDLQVSVMEMFEYFRDLRIEIALEMVNRRTGIQIEAATLATIFSNRVVVVASR